MQNRRKCRRDIENGLPDTPSPGSCFGVKSLVFVTVVAFAGGLIYLWKLTQSDDGPHLQGSSPREGVSQAPAVPSPNPPSKAEIVDPPKLSFPDLQTALPESTRQLLDELNRVTDSLQACVPGHPDTWEIAARVQFWVGNSEEAVRMWERCLELDPRYGYAYSGMGSAAAKRGDYEAAAAFYRKALELRSDSSETQLALGEALVNAGKMDEAIVVLDRISSPGPNMARRDVLLGQAYLHTQDYESARAQYESAIRHDPSFSEAYYGLATISARLSATDEAAKWMSEFQEVRAREIEMRTKDKRTYDDLEATRWEVALKYTEVGRVLYSHHFGTEAEKVWQRAAALAPRQIDCRQAMAWVYRQSNRKEDAIRILEQLAEIEQGAIQYDLEIGRIHAELGNFDAARQAFQRVRETDLRHPDGYLAAARLFLDARRSLPEAVAMAREAVVLEPTASNYALLSEACEMNGERAEALSAIRHAVDLAPGEVQYQQRLNSLNTEP